MPSVSTQIEIAAAPAEVRKTFLDFASYPSWAKAHVKSIEVTSGNKDDIKPGDKLKVTLSGATFSPVVKANDPEEFRWLGSLPLIFSGEHFFQLKPSTIRPGHTTLVQGEDFSGLLSFPMAPGWTQGKKLKTKFEDFNRELKARVEGS